MPPNVGEKAPDFTLIDTDRKPRSLAEFKGKNVVLAFFPGAFTGGCSAEACTLQNDSVALNSLNAQVVGVAPDSHFAIKGWAEHNKLTYPILTDHKREVIRKYGTSLVNFAGMEGYETTQRAVYVLDKDGVVRYRWVGAPTEQPPYPDVKQALQGLK